MKRIVAFILFLFLAYTAYSQKIQGALIAGMNASQVDGDEVFGFHKYGFVGGAAAILPFTKKWSVSIETIYNQKGSYQRSTNTSANNGSYHLFLDYLDVPLLVHFTDKERITFGTGLSWGKLVNVKEYEHGRRVESTTLNGPYKRDDVDFLIDIRFRLYKNLKFNFRYNYSIQKIRTRLFTSFVTGDSWERKQYNNFISFRLVYVINEKSLPITTKKTSKK